MLPDLDPASVEDAVGVASFVRGMHYVRQRAVIDMEWDSSENALHGIVRGRTGEFNTTMAYLSQADGSRLSFERGQCSCPVRVNCKHAVALVLAAVDASDAPAATRQAPPSSSSATPATPATRPAPPPATPAAWEKSLDTLLDARPAAADRRPNETPLAIEVALSGDLHPTQSQGSVMSPAPLKVVARLVQAGKNGGWIGGDISWGKLDSLLYNGSFPAAQVRLLREIYAVYRSRGSQAAYHYSSSYGYSHDKMIELSAFESRQLWPLLDEAESIGLKLVYPRKLGLVERYRCAEFCLDVTSDDRTGALVIAPVLQVGGAPADVTLIRFIGSEAHGVAYADRAETGGSDLHGGWHFRLAKLTKAVPPQLQHMALACQRLEIPAAEQPRFRDGYFPRLRHAATMISSDGSFTPPAISGPTLVLHAAYQDGHHVEASWDWAYQVGDARLSASPHNDSPAAGYRDLEAERLVLASLDLPPDRFGLLRPDLASAELGQALAPHVQLGGIDTMRFTTELLPLLADQAGVAVDVTGDPADYREASDSLRIGVSTDAVADDPDWFDLGITITIEERQVPFIDVFTALSRGESHLLLASGAYFSLEKPELQALARLIEEARALQDAPDGELKISRFQAGLWDELAELGVVNHQARAWQEQVQGLLSIGAIDRKEPPETLHGRLRPYQLDGFQWLAFLWQHQLGGILADDMGLGKTLQSLALICHAKQVDPAISPFLIVAPTSVVPNWRAEAARFTPGLNVVSISDTMSRRGQDLGEVITGADVVVTSYTLLRIDFDAYSKLGWSGLILDEAQFTKNHQSKIYQCARRLPAPFKVAITGTPMENNVMELWSLLSITAPGLFPNPSRFRDYYARPIEKQGNAELLAQLRRRIKPLVKRRTKEQVATDLPAKQEQVLEVDLHPRHRKLYQTHLQRERQKVLGLIDDMNSNRFTILRSLTLLRQLSLHAGLVDEEYRDLPSSKIDVLLEQLGDVVGGGHRALVFSQFTGFLDKVRGRLDAADVQYCYLDGKTRDRATVLRQFKDGSVPVFLISLKAGGFGLNLTEADYCFLLDPWWNPATEAQAVDRTHRIGQTRNVMVYRLIAKDTIEEKVMALKRRKAELFSSVLDSGNAFGASIDADDIRGLFA
jgi:superfamily II DNA or RNA helicase